MRYNQLQEAIIKVPQEILTKVNMYVASYLYFKIKQYVDKIQFMLPTGTSEEEKNRIIKDAQTTMGKLQSKYGAKNISTETANSIVNHSINIPIDVERFFQELNFKGVTPGLISLMKDRMKLSLLIKSHDNNLGGSKESFDNYSALVTVVVGRLNHNPSFLETASDIMSNAYHELQHVVQAFAIKNINKNDNQLERKPGYSKEFSDGEDYYTSGIEFTPQLGNVIDSITVELEKSALNDELNPNKNEAIKKAIEYVVQNNQESRTFLIHLYRKQPDRYKKAMSALYKNISPIYDNIKQSGIDYSNTELPSEELEANVDVMLTVYKMMYKKDEYKVQAFGKTMDKLVQIEIKKDSWTIVLTKNKTSKDGSYYLNIISHDPEFEEQEKLNSKQVLSLFGTLSSVTWYDSTDIIDDLEFITGERRSVNKESINDIIMSLKEDAQHMGVDFKQSNPTQFTVLGQEFSVIEVEDSSDKIDISYADKTLYVWTLKQLLITFQMLIRYSVSYPDEVNQILDKDTMYVEFMASLRKL